MLPLNRSHSTGKIQQCRELRIKSTELFAMKILKSTDDRSDNRKLIVKCKIFIALVRGLQGFMRVFLQLNEGGGTFILIAGDNLH